MTGRIMIGAGGHAHVLADALRACAVSRSSCALSCARAVWGALKGNSPALTVSEARSNGMAAVATAVREIFMRALPG